MSRYFVDTCIRWEMPITPNRYITPAQELRSSQRAF
jgi:hypothetical protein